MKHRVLLVDDEPAFLSATARSLGGAFEVLRAESGQEALDLLRGKAVDAVVTDLRMPAMDGVELLSRVAELSPTTARIAMSAFSDSAALVEAINQGSVMAFLIKPFTLQEIASAIYRSVARAKASRPSGSVLVWLGPGEGQAISGWLAAAGLSGFSCADEEQAHLRMLRGNWDLLLLDLDLPGALDLLHAANTAYPDTWPLLVTNDRSRLLTQELGRLGARDLVAKPLHEPELLLRIHRLLAEREEAAQLDGAELAAESGEQPSLLVGESPVMASLRQMIRTVAAVECSVLIRGETGTGKELVATALHRQGKRASGPLLAVNCAALTETLFESEVFGHERGAFTGAVQQKRGLCELASEGSLLLDEIGELSPGVQAKLLRFMETGEFFRVGGTEALRSAARVLAATNRDLVQMIDEGTFRADLYHRLSTIEIYVPPLRERAEDIPQLVSHFLTRLARQHVRPSISIAPEALQELLGYDWPGNVRELQSVLERGLLLSTDSRIRPGLLPERAARAASTDGEPALAVDLERPLREAVDQLTRRAERDYLLRSLALCGGNVSEVARRSGVDRRNLYRKLEALGIEPTQFRRRRPGV